MTAAGAAATLRDATRGRPAPARGFSLVEVCVAVAILAIATGVMIPALNGLSRAEMRRGARQLAANVRRCFDEAALSGQTYRLVFTLDRPSVADPGPDDPPPKPPIAVESSELSLNFTGHDGALTEAADPNEVDLLADSPLQGALGSPDTAADSAPAAQDTASAAGSMFRDMFNVNKLAQKQGRPSFDAVGEVTLPRGVRVKDVWFDGMHEPATEGSLALIFFPTGYTQHAVIHLEDDDGNVFTLDVEPLTGRSRMAEGNLREVPEYDAGAP